VGAPKVAIVNEEFARKFHLDRDAVGKRMKPDSGGPGDLNYEIVGLVQNSKYSEVKQQIPPVFYLPYRQDELIGRIGFYVRGSTETAKLLSIVQPVVAKIDRNLPVEELQTMEKTVLDNVAPDRIVTILSACFASLATLLAAIGL